VIVPLPWLFPIVQVTEPLKPTLFTGLPPVSAIIACMTQLNPDG
jgi:hypothetical protein